MRATIRRTTLEGRGAFICLLSLLALGGCGESDGVTSDEGSQASEKTERSERTERPRFVGAIDLESTELIAIAYGKASIYEQDGERSIVVQAQADPNRPGEAYQLWLYNDLSDAESLGAQTTDAQGAFSGSGALPEDYGRFRFIDVSAETIRGPEGHSGGSVLRGRLRPKVR